MSGYKVINAVDETLKALLWSGMQADGEITSIPLNENDISLEPPFLLIKEDKPLEDCLSVYLYRLSENGEMKNRPLERVNATTLRFPPLSLNLYYLVTPLTNSSANDHRLLSKAMQILYDNAIIKGSLLQGELKDSAEELRVNLSPLGVEEVNKIWTSFMRPLRLSVCYEVKVVYIDSEREAAGQEVRSKRLDFMQFSEVKETA